MNIEQIQTMNGNWEGITNLAGAVIPLPSSPPILAQSPISWAEQLITSLGNYLGTSLIDLIKAVLILLVGWIVAVIARGFIKAILSRTELDNKVAGWFAGEGTGENIPIESWVSTIVYWIILLFAVVAFLQALQLEVVSAPLTSLLEQITSFLPQIGAAALLLGIAWLLATVVKAVVVRLLCAVNVDERLNDTGATGDDFSLSQTMGNVLYWFIFLLFLPAILSTLQLEGTLTPVQSMVGDILSAVPNIFKAGLIFAIGWFIATFVRRVVSNLLGATGVNQLGERFGLSSNVGGQSLSQILGTIVYALVLIPVAISALQALQIEAISTPAIAMLNQVMNFLPKIFSAGIILAFFFFLGKFVSELVTNILSSIGFDNISEWLGLPFLATPTADAEAARPETGQETVLQKSPQLATQTPSELFGVVVLIAITFVGVLTAVDILQIDALASVVGLVMAIAGRVFLGLVVLAIGLFFANLTFKLVTSSGGSSANTLGQIARISIIALVSAMALDLIGISSSIVNLAFGLLLGAIAGAILLAFGLGGRDVAGEQLREWLDSFKKG